MWRACDAKIAKDGIFLIAMFAGGGWKHQDVMPRLPCTEYIARPLLGGTGCVHKLAR